jgi:glycerol-3-phosphate dehydrogenase
VERKVPHRHTDIRYEEDLDYVSADEDEIDYLIEETNHVIPEANLSRDAILFTYSGIRPLPYQPEGAEGGVTRSHIVYDHAKGRGVGTKRTGIGEGVPRVGGLISIIGGKLTTYRNLSARRWTWSTRSSTWIPLRAARPGSPSPAAR